MTEIHQLVLSRPYLEFLTAYQSWYPISIPPFQHQYLHVFTNWDEFVDCGTKLGIEDNPDFPKDGSKIYLGMAWYGTSQAKKEKFNTFKCLIFINKRGYGNSTYQIESTIDHELHHIVSNVLKYYGFDLNESGSEEFGAHLGDWLKWRILIEIFNKKGIQ